MNKVRGPSISIDNQSAYTSLVNRYKQSIGTAPASMVREFKPLQQWPACKHIREDDLQAFRQIPSFKP